MNTQQRSALANIRCRGNHQSTYARRAIIERFPQYENWQHAAHCVDMYDDMLNCLRLAQLEIGNEYVKSLIGQCIKFAEGGGE